MKIAFDAKRAFHNFRGLGNYSRTLIEGLVLNFPENEYVLYTPPFKDERARTWYEDLKKKGNLKLVVPSSFLTQTFSSSWRSLFLTNVLKKDKPDIFHGLSHELPPKIDQLGIKTVVTIHDLLFMRYPTMFSSVDRRIYKKKYTYSCQVANKVVAICEQTKNDLGQYLKVDADKVDVVYQSCDPIFYNLESKARQDEVRKKYFLPHHYILYVGAFSKLKNLEHLITSYKYVSQYHDLPLVLVGQGAKYRHHLVQHACKLNLENHVIFLEDVPSRDLPALYQQATVFVFPSLFEGFGIPIIESLFSGVPVITSTGSCFGETGGDAVEYVDPHDSDKLGKAMTRLVENDKLREEMSEKGHKWVKRFHLELTSTNMIKLYKSLLS